MINHLNFNSLFIADHSDNIRYFDHLQNKNRIKLSEEQLLFLKKLHDDYSKEKESIAK